MLPLMSREDPGVKRLSGLLRAVTSLHMHEVYFKPRAETTRLLGFRVISIGHRQLQHAYEYSWVYTRSVPAGHGSEETSPQSRWPCHTAGASRNTEKDGSRLTSAGSGVLEDFLGEGKECRLGLKLLKMLRKRLSQALLSHTRQGEAAECKKAASATDELSVQGGHSSPLPETPRATRLYRPSEAARGKKRPAFTFRFSLIAWFCRTDGSSCRLTAVRPHQKSVHVCPPRTQMSGATRGLWTREISSNTGELGHATRTQCQASSPGQTRAHIHKRICLFLYCL